MPTVPPVPLDSTGRSTPVSASARIVPDILMRLGGDLVFLYVSPSLAEAVGTRPETFLGRRLTERLQTPPVTAAWETALREVLRSRQAQEIECVSVLPAGERIFQVRLMPELAHGAVTTILCIARDVTAARRAEAALCAQVRLHAALARLGLRALENADIDALWPEAVVLTAEALEAEVSDVLRWFFDTVTPTQTIPEGTAESEAVWRRSLGISDAKPARSRDFTPAETDFLRAVARLLETAHLRRRAEQEPPRLAPTAAVSASISEATIPTVEPPKIEVVAAPTVNAAPDSDERTSFSAPNGTSSAAGPTHILVIDDNMANQTAALLLLGKIGCRVDGVTEQSEALRLLEAKRYDLILLDCRRSEADIYQTTSEIRRREEPGRYTPIVAVTTDQMPGARERCFAAGMDACLHRPLREAELRKTVTALLGIS